MGYINDVYSEYEKHVENDEIKPHILEKPVTTLSKYRKILDSCSARMLRLSGVGRELELVQDIGRPVRFVIGALEEMIGEALVGPYDLLALYRTSRLTFQTK
jgi:hypothetical protein